MGVREDTTSPTIVCDVSRLSEWRRPCERTESLTSRARRNSAPWRRSRRPSTLSFAKLAQTTGRAVEHAAMPCARSQREMMRTTIGQRRRGNISVTTRGDDGWPPRLHAYHADVIRRNRCAPHGHCIQEPYRRAGARGLLVGTLPPNKGLESVAWIGGTRISWGATCGCTQCFAPAPFVCENAALTRQHALPRTATFQASSGRTEHGLYAYHERRQP